VRRRRVVQRVGEAGAQAGGIDRGDTEPGADQMRQALFPRHQPGGNQPAEHDCGAVLCRGVERMAPHQANTGNG
jgi:hypothetical protein